MNIHRQFPLAAVALLILLAGCAGLAGDLEIVGTVPPQAVATTDPAAEPFQMPPTMPDLVNGQRIFAESCTRCHGLDGAGGGELVQSGEVPRMPSFLEAAHMRQQAPRDYYEIITNGSLINLMPFWRDSLSVQERWDVAMYVYTLHYTPEQLERGWQISGATSANFQADSDTALAQARGGSTEDTFAAVAYERVLSTRGFAAARGIELTFLVEPPTPTPLESLTFSGTVTNGTAGGTVPDGTLVTLRYGNAEDGVQVQETTIDAQRGFRFDGIPYNPTYQYFAVATYQGRGFVSNLQSAGQVSAVNELPVTIYETTSDPNTVTLRTVELVADVLTVDGLGTGLVFAQTNIYENATDRMFAVTPQGQTVSVSLLLQLPVGSVILNNTNDPRYLIAQDQYALVDTLPVYPGSHILEVLYFVPYQDGAVIDLPLNNQLDGTVDVYLADERLSLSGEGFAYIDETEVGSGQQTVPAKHYQATLQSDSGDSIVFDVAGNVAGLPANSTSGISGNQWVPVLLIASAVLLLLGAAVIAVLRMRSSRSGGQREIDQLVAELAQLEDLHAAGRINHDYYQQKRQEIRQRLSQKMAGNPEPNDQ